MFIILSVIQGRSGFGSTKALILLLGRIGGSHLSGQRLKQLRFLFPVFLEEPGFDHEWAFWDNCVRDAIDKFFPDR